jgi:hypothetical protein
VWAALFTIAATDLALLVLLASLTRLSLAGRAARRCLAARTALA